MPDSRLIGPTNIFVMLRKSLDLIKKQTARSHAVTLETKLSSTRRLISLRAQQLSLIAETPAQSSNRSRLRLIAVRVKKGIPGDLRYANFPVRDSREQLANALNGIQINAPVAFRNLRCVCVLRSNLTMEGRMASSTLFTISTFATSISSESAFALSLR